MRIILICGGPSLERGISLNSARSVMDHLEGTPVDLSVLYVDQSRHVYPLSKAQLYSNTPADFDFKLPAKGLTEAEYLAILKGADLVFPLIHGIFGEDGGLQSLLEEHAIPYVGCGAKTCETIFDKYTSRMHLQEAGYPILKGLKIDLAGEAAKELRVLEDFWQENKLQRAILKPTRGGSSLGVESFESLEACKSKVESIINNKATPPLNTHWLLEPFCEGQEFTICVIESLKGEPVALLPTYIETSYEENGIFDYRRKYLPTNQVRYQCPPPFDEAIIRKIRQESETLFKHFKMRGFVRIDGWYLKDGRCLYTDFNPISGMEQNSFIFQQAAHVGLCHSELLLYLLATAKLKYTSAPSLGEMQYANENTRFLNAPKANNEAKGPVKILFGGNTAERQVSLMSGTNTFFKLKLSSLYQPESYLWAKDQSVWQVPYHLMLYHTVEEVAEACSKEAKGIPLRDTILDIRSRLGLYTQDFALEKPRKLSLESFLQEAKEEQAFVFLGLHGGEGEDGTLQAKLETYGIPYNGSGPQASQVGMDKSMTAEIIQEAKLEGVSSIISEGFYRKDLALLTEIELAHYWQATVDKLGSSVLLIKPVGEGCSAGIICLYRFEDFQTYIRLLGTDASEIPPHTFFNQESIVAMPQDRDKLFLIQAYVDVDSLKISGKDLIHVAKDGWFELTCGVLERGSEPQAFHILSPSLTLIEAQILSLEEKFQGGTGINLTPPPAHLISPQQIAYIQDKLKVVAALLKIKNYARIDLFFNRYTQHIFILEVNNLPALTPSTVLFHQALCERPPIYPKELFENIIGQAWGR